MADDLLTFELLGEKRESLELEIHGDPAGLRRLADVLARLASQPSSDHDHLFTPAWAGDELSEEKQGDGTVLNKITIHCWVPKP